MISSPLIRAHNFLSSHGYFWPGDANVGTATIIFNVCYLAGLIAIANGLLVGIPLGMASTGGGGVGNRFMSTMPLLLFGLFAFMGALDQLKNVSIVVGVMEVVAGVLLFCLAILSCSSPTHRGSGRNALPIRTAQILPRPGIQRQANKSHLSATVAASRSSIP